jgi:hypothetical protein
MIALLARFPPTGPMLDVGCGSGDLSMYLAQLGYQVLGYVHELALSLRPAGCIICMHSTSTFPCPICRARSAPGRCEHVLLQREAGKSKKSNPRSFSAGSRLRCQPSVRALSDCLDNHLTQKEPCRSGRRHNDDQQAT